HDKVRHTRHKRQLHRGKLLLQVSASAVHGFLCFPLVRMVSQCGERTRQSNTVDVKRLSRFLENLNEITSSDPVAYPQAGQAMDLGKRAQNDNVLSLAHVSQRIGRVVEKFKIGFIENS